LKLTKEHATEKLSHLVTQNPQENVIQDVFTEKTIKKNLDISQNQITTDIKETQVQN
jgi:hypothetical protein